MPVPFDLPASSPMTHTCGQPVIFLLYGISSPGEEAEPLAEPLPVWLPRRGREGTLSPCPVLDPWAAGVGFPQWCLLVPLILAMQPLSLPFLSLEGCSKLHPSWP